MNYKYSTSTSSTRMMKRIPHKKEVDLGLYLGTFGRTMSTCTCIRFMLMVDFFFRRRRQTTTARFPRRSRDIMNAIRTRGASVV